MSRGSAQWQCQWSVLFAVVNGVENPCTKSFRSVTTTAGHWPLAVSVHLLSSRWISSATFLLLPRKKKEEEEEQNQQFSQ